MKRFLVVFSLIFVVICVGCSNRSTDFNYKNNVLAISTQKTTSTLTKTYIDEITTTVWGNAEKTETLTTVETTFVTTESTETTIATTTQNQSRHLPDDIMNLISNQINNYPGMQVAAGIYSLDKKESYVYNENKEISSGCTVKAPYAMFVLKQCEELDIDIDSYTLVYEPEMLNEGSGVIKEDPYWSEYTISELLNVLLGVSDNTAYNILLSKFSLFEYQKFLQTINGQELKGCRYGATTVENRKNEWFEIYNYIKSNSKYSQKLKDFLTGTQYCYLAQGMEKEHNYMHKSGWADGSSYTCACDCGIFDDKYLVIVLTEDYSIGEGHTNTLCSIGWAVEQEFLLK